MFIKNKTKRKKNDIVFSTTTNWIIGIWRTTNGGLDLIINDSFFFKKIAECISFAFYADEIIVGLTVILLSLIIKSGSEIIMHAYSFFSKSKKQALIKR